jgi:hypothetical protein
VNVLNAGRMPCGYLFLRRKKVLYSLIKTICGILDLLSFVVSILAFAVAFYIPRKIMINQIYADLLREYRSPEFGEAITGLINFYIEDCNRDISQVYKKYMDRYKNEKKEIKSSLHFKRRLLWQYYWHLSTLRYEYVFGRLTKGRLKKNFTENESHIINLLYHTIEAARNCFNDIGNVAEAGPKDGRTEECIYRLYEESKDW